MRLSAHFGVTIAIVGIANAGQLERVAPDTEVPSVSSDELASAIEDSDATVELFDVRLEEDFAADPELIPEATWRNPHDIATWAEELSPDTKIVVYCVHGKWVSQSVTKKLRDMGLDVSQLSGGIEAWKSSGKPTKAAKTP